MQVTDIPSWLADAWSINLEAAQVILSVVVILFVILPVFIVARGKGTIVIIVLLFVTLSFLVGIGWLPFWILVTSIVMMAATVAYLGSETITGRG